ncbi:MAG TPA: NADH-ubiquinone oxidoreductase-F iron-sulfur binding region domain-containing protein [Candidatus Limnocylindria bacterium]|nr:NADH-ubiquinone oxidoreductase-F iron-sulfur binding region domain-containing protein [Candidatus Limnocylindria bacterium]
MIAARYPVVATPLVGALSSPRLGPPPVLDLESVVGLAESAGLRGRGGAGFPAARKIRAVADRRRRPVVVVNAAEGEPASGKDAALLRHAPHLVLDGAEILARALGTRDVRVWAPGHDPGAAAVLASAVAERAAERRRRAPVVQVVLAPARFVAGESTAAARGLSGRAAIPRADGRRTSVTGVDRRPTLLLNTETVVQLARLARGLPTTRLVTVLGAVEDPGVVELPDESRLTTAIEAAGGLSEPVRAYALGGYHGRWWSAEEAETLWLGDPDGPVADCSIVVALPEHGCLLSELEEVARFLAGESAGQCGPCAFGLPELAASVERVSRGLGTPAAVEAHRDLLVGRGACFHPDGSIGFLSSGLAVLAAEVEEHLVGRGSCGRPWRRILPVPSAEPRAYARTVLAERSA